MPTSNQLQRDATGQLVNTQLPGVPVAPAPVTPATSAAQGASPDQAKMAGTPAQKAPVLNQAVAQTATLSGQQRLTPTPSPSQADVAEQAAGDRLAKLGSYGTRIKALVNERLSQVAQTPQMPIIDQGALSALLVGKSTQDQTKITQALTNYLQGGRTEAQLATLQDAVGPGGLAGGVLGSLVTQPTQVQGQAPVTVGALGLAQAGVDPAQLAQDLGVTQAQLEAYTPDQFQAAVQSQIAQHFSNTDALKAEYTSATPARQAQILAELRTRGESGVSATELAVAHLADKLQQAEEIDLGDGVSANVQDLLKDEGVSALITDAVSNPTRLATLAKTQPALAQWITQNKASLDALHADMGQQVQALQATQTAYNTTVQGLTPELRKAFGVVAQGTQTAASLQAAKDKLANSASYQALQADPSLGQLFQDNPSLVAEFDKRGLSPKEISSVVSTSNGLKQDPDVLELAHIDNTAPVLFLSPAEQQSVEHVKETLDMIGLGRQTPAFATMKANGLLNATTLSSLAHSDLNLADPTLTKLLQDGTVSTSGEVRKLAAKPELLQVLKRGQQQNSQLADVGSGNMDPQEEMRVLFGNPNLSVPAVVAGFKNAQQTMPTAKFQALIRPLDTNQDGKIDESDFAQTALATLAQQVRAALPGAKGVLEGADRDPLGDLQGLVGSYAAEGAEVQDRQAKAAAKAQQDRAHAQELADQMKRQRDIDAVNAAEQARKDKAAQDEAQRQAATQAAARAAQEKQDQAAFAAAVTTAFGTNPSGETALSRGQLPANYQEALQQLKSAKTPAEQRTVLAKLYPSYAQWAYRRDEAANR